MIDAVPDLVASSVLAAVTVIDPADAGAVNSPLESIVPPLAVHFTVELKVPVPCTVAVHWEVAFVAIVEGLHVTATEEIVGGLDGMATITVAVPDLLESSLLVAVTVTVAAEFGAVSIPFASIVPPLAVHVTIELYIPVPCTVALHCEVAPVEIEEGVHTTETEEIMGGVVMVFPPTEPPPQPATSNTSSDADITQAGRNFNPLALSLAFSATFLNGKSARKLRLIRIPQCYAPPAARVHISTANHAPASHLPSHAPI